MTKNSVLRQWLVSTVLAFWVLVVHAERPLVPERVEGTTRVSAEQVVELINTLPGLVILDSRHSEEFAKGHIEGAINLLDTHMQQADLKRLAPKRDTPLLFYCNGERCARSSNAASKAVGWGYRKIYWFRNGWQEWSAKHLPVAK